MTEKVITTNGPKPWKEGILVRDSAVAGDIFWTTNDIANLDGFTYVKLVG